MTQTKFHHSSQSEAEKECLPNGHLNNDVDVDADWRTSKPFAIDDLDIVEGVDVYTSSWYNGSIDLDTIVELSFVSVLSIHIHISKNEWQTLIIKLIDIPCSEWISNNSTSRVAKKVRWTKVDGSFNSFQTKINTNSDNETFYLTFKRVLCLRMFFKVRVWFHILGDKSHCIRCINTYESNQQLLIQFTCIKDEKEMKKNTLVLYIYTCYLMF